MPIDVEAYYRTYGPMVLRRCRRMLKGEAEAVDAMHDTFVQLLRYEDRLDDAAPSSLMYRIATNVCLNRIKAKKRRPEDPDDDVLGRIAALSALEGGAEARSLLARFFRGEQDSTVQMCVLYLVDEMTLEEVAREVGMSVSGVRKRLRGLRARIAELEGV